MAQWWTQMAAIKAVIRQINPSTSSYPLHFAHERDPAAKSGFVDTQHHPPNTLVQHWVMACATGSGNGTLQGKRDAPTVRTKGPCCECKYWISGFVLHNVTWSDASALMCTIRSVSIKTKDMIGMTQADQIS